MPEYICQTCTPPRTFTRAVALASHRRKHEREAQPKATGDVVTIGRADFQLLMDQIKELRTTVAEMRAVEPEDPTQMKELQSVYKLPADQRAEALIEVLANLTPEQRARREQAILGAYRNLPPAPEATADLRPGSYVDTGRKDPGHVPILDKVRYTKEWMEANYDMVDLWVDPFYPVRGGFIQFAEVRYEAPPGQARRVPSIIKWLYDNYVAAVKAVDLRHRPLDGAENERINNLIALGNKQVWSRVYRAGVGLMPAESLPNQEATAPAEARPA